MPEETPKIQWTDLTGSQQKLAQEYRKAREQRIPAFHYQDQERLKELGAAHEEAIFFGKAVSVEMTWDQLSLASRLPEASEASTSTSAPDQSTHSAGTGQSA